MFLNLLKNFFLKKNKRNTVTANQSSHNENVAVLINMDSVTHVDQLKKILTTDIFPGKNISFIDFKELPEKNITEGIPILSNKSFNWKAQLIDDWAVKQFEKPYNICLAFSKQNNYINKLANITKARYKFEVSDTRNDIFDVSLIYSMSENSDYIEGLKNYLKSFNLIN
jgi:hypothetical protein